MIDLLKEATKYTPRIHFSLDERKLEVVGFSLPENVADIYMPALVWLDEFEQELQQNSELQNEKFQLNFQLSYFNSGSLRFIIDILKKANHIQGLVAEISINWYYEDGDTQILESGNELSRLVNIPFNLVEIE